MFTSWTEKTETINGAGSVVHLLLLKCSIVGPLDRKRTTQVITRGARQWSSLEESPFNYKLGCFKNKIKKIAFRIFFLNWEVIWQVSGSSSSKELHGLGFETLMDLAQ